MEIQSLKDLCIDELNSPEARELALSPNIDKDKLQLLEASHLENVYGEISGSSFGNRKCNVNWSHDFPKDFINHAKLYKYDKTHKIITIKVRDCKYPFFSSTLNYHWSN